MKQTETTPEAQQEPVRPERNRRAPRINKRGPGLLVAVGVLLFLAIAAFVIVQLLQNKSQQPEQTPDTAVSSNTVTLAAVGDIHMDAQLLAAAKQADNTYDFSAAFLPVADLLAKADVTVGNLECSFAGSTYTDTEGWAPDSLAGNLAGMGFDLLQTANSYSILGGLNGLTQSMQTVQAAGMQCVGTAVSKSDYKDNHGIVLVEKNGIRIAFVAFTKGLNNMSLPSGASYAVNLLYQDYDTNYSKIDTDRIVQVMQAAQKQRPDVVVALVHWGVEDDTKVGSTQEKIADLLVSNGADVIIGSHSHLVGRFETRKVSTDDGEKTAFIAYDLGDFYASSEKVGQQQSIVLQLEWTRDKLGNVELSAIDYTPVYRVQSKTGSAVRYEIWDAGLAMELYTQGYIHRVSDDDYKAISKAVEDLKSTIGTDYDAPQNDE